MSNDPPVLDRRVATCGAGKGYAVDCESDVPHHRPFNFSDARCLRHPPIGLAASDTGRNGSKRDTDHVDPLESRSHSTARTVLRSSLNPAIAKAGSYDVTEQSHQNRIPPAAGESNRSTGQPTGCYRRKTRTQAQRDARRLFLFPERGRLTVRRRASVTRNEKRGRLFISDEWRRGYPALTDNAYATYPSEIRAAD